MKKRNFTPLSLLLCALLAMQGQMMNADNGKRRVDVQPGAVYNYNFSDGSVLPQTSYTSKRYETFVSPDGVLTINSNTAVASQQFGFHDAQHGAVLFPGNSMGFVVAGNATITFGTCQYGSAVDAVFEVKDPQGNLIGTAPAKNHNAQCGTHSITYTGHAGVLTATLKSETFPTAEIYIHGVSVENAPEIIQTNKIDVWDFGAAQLDAEYYNNHLTENVINAWYPGVVAGTTGIPLPGGFSAGVLSWVGGTNSDRIRTSNTNLTRYDSNGSPATWGAETFTGSLYVNAGSTSARYIGLTLSEDDEVTLYAKTQNGNGRITFQYMADDTQKDVLTLGSSVNELKFVAKKGGSYHIYDSADKPFYYRILRKNATYATLSGTLELSQAAGIPAGYSIVFTNETGKSWSSVVGTGNTYSVRLPVGYTYALSLSDASGYIISNTNQITLTEDLNHQIAIKKVEMYAVSGSITGLPADRLPHLALTFTPTTPQAYVPAPVVDVAQASYAVALEPNIDYTVAANGVNDYLLTTTTINIGGATTHNLIFTSKPTYRVTINAVGLNTEQQNSLKLTFTNLNEAGYVYEFTGINGIHLRDGAYSVVASGLEQYPLQLALTANLKVAGSEVTKSLDFVRVVNWSFDDSTIINGVTAVYKGMLFAGSVYNEKAKGHLVLRDNGTAQVPLRPMQKLVVTYYYSANFTVDGGEATTTNSGSTSKLESKAFVYTGTTDGYMTIANIAGTTTYLTDIRVENRVEYTPTITVGVGKDYRTINEALVAVRSMNRGVNDRVKIFIEPGNYEEMLVVDVPNISLINASATPSISLSNRGVDIAPHAVRITSYYGHGYNYFSMGADQKWNADVLRVNKENGYNSYVNTGSGTTNNSYWNATVVVMAPGFEAKNIIFENSFNQYISRKEAEDVVIEWTSGGKGTRPTDMGNTAVQNKSFVERAAAIAFTQSADKAVLYKCRVIGRQDSFYGAEGARVVAYKGSLMGGTDYLFGGMTLVGYKSDLAMNTSETSTDVAYITAAQQASARGYLLYECSVTSAQPGTETASAYRSKPGYFGRPWLATTSEVVFYNTTIKTSDNPNFLGQSMIVPAGWNNSLGGEAKAYEYGTIEQSGVNNAANRVSWASVLTTPTLPDGTAITPYNFTKGTDGWDPIPVLEEEDTETTVSATPNLNVEVKVFDNHLFVCNVKTDTLVRVYGVDGKQVVNRKVSADVQIPLDKGFWIVKADNEAGHLLSKIMIK